MSHSYVWHVSFICVTCLIHMCDMSHSYVCHVSFICGPGRDAHTHALHTQHTQHTQHTHTYLVKTNESSYTYELFMPQVWVRHVTCMRESCHTYEWVMQHKGADLGFKGDDKGAKEQRSHVSCMSESCHSYERVIPLAWMRHATRMNESCHTCECVMSLVRMSIVTQQ